MTYCDVITIWSLFHKTGFPGEPFAVPEAVDGREEHEHVEAEQDKDGRVEVQLQGLDGEEAGVASNVWLFGLAHGNEVVINQSHDGKKKEGKTPGDQRIKKKFERICQIKKSLKIKFHTSNEFDRT